MGLRFDAYDDCLQMGDLVSQQLTWERDVTCVTKMAGLEPAGVNTAAPTDLVSNSFAPDLGLSTNAADWATDVDLQLFSGLNDGTFYQMDLECLLDNKSTEDAVAVDLSKTAPWITTCSGALSLADSTFSSLKDISSLGSPDSGIGSVEAVSSPGSMMSLEVAPSPALITSKEDIALLESLWQDGPAALEASSKLQTGAQALLTTVTLDPTRYTKLSPAPASVKPSKAVAADRRARKREQNKNAATRYREKKRAEANAIFEEQTKLEDKNRALQDKVTLITREMQYMKELLIEVYRAKGRIE